MEEECVSPFGFGEAKGDRVEEGGGYFQLRGKAGVEKDVMPMWVFLFPLSGGCFFFGCYGLLVLCLFTWTLVDRLSASESFGPLYSPETDGFARVAPLTLGRLSAAFAPSPIAV